MLKNKKSMVMKALIRTILAVIVLFVLVMPACNRLRENFFSGRQVVAGLLNPVEGGECMSNFNDGHKAVDIIADCGTPVVAACDGKIQRAGPGLSGDSVFGGTAGGGEEGLLLDNLENCKDDTNDWSDYRVFYGCVHTGGYYTGGYSTGPVKQGDMISAVGECENHDEEKRLGCHIHFVLVKGALGGGGSASACEHLNDIG